MTKWPPGEPFVLGRALGTIFAAPPRKGARCASMSAAGIYVLGSGRLPLKQIGTAPPVSPPPIPPKPGSNCRQPEGIDPGRRVGDISVGIVPAGQPDRIGGDDRVVIAAAVVVEARLLVGILPLKTDRVGDIRLRLPGDAAPRAKVGAPCDPAIVVGQFLRRAEQVDMIILKRGERVGAVRRAWSSGRRLPGLCR